MNRIAMLNVAGMALLTVIYSGTADAGTGSNDRQRYLCDKDSKGNLSCQPEGASALVNNVVKDHMNDPYWFAKRNEMDFRLTPGGGWIAGGIPQIVLGAPAMVAGIIYLAADAGCSCTGKSSLCFCGLATDIGAISLASGALLTASGGTMVGYGVAQNKRFLEGEIDYISPATGYIVGGALNALVGSGFVLAGALTDPHYGLAIASMAVGSGFTAYGLGFLIYGAVTDFHKEAGADSTVKKTLGSLTPYFKCVGGSCDGNTDITTGREVYCGGLQGVF